MTIRGIIILSIRSTLPFQLLTVGGRLPSASQRTRTLVRQTMLRGSRGMLTFCSVQWKKLIFCCSVLQAAQNDLTSGTYNMLTRVTDWSAFSNHTVGDGGSTSNSLEAVHDSIHFYVGGGGHMSDPGVAGILVVILTIFCTYNVGHRLRPYLLFTPRQC